MTDPLPAPVIDDIPRCGICAALVDLSFPHFVIARQETLLLGGDYFITNDEVLFTYCQGCKGRGELTLTFAPTVIDVEAPAEEQAS